MHTARVDKEMATKICSQLLCIFVPFLVNVNSLLLTEHWHHCPVAVLEKNFRYRRYR